MSNAAADRDEPRYTLFYGGPFSQWYHSPFSVDGVLYTCAEQYMMAQKARLFRDDVRLAMIMETSDPSEQKALGKMVRNFRVDVWEAVARDVVARATFAKFNSRASLLEELLETAGTVLVEASPTDVIWGIGLSEYDADAHRRAMWRGRNWLGQVLTDVRDLMLAPHVLPAAGR